MSILSTFLYLYGGTLVALSTANAIESKQLNGDNNIEPPIDTVSIIIPSYNEEKYIKDNLLSLRNQSIVHKYPNLFEYILIDSNSTDKTVELAKPYVDTIIHAPKGKLTARNLATLYSKGNIIVSVDSDTIYPYDWLNTLLKPFIKIPDTVAVVGSTTDTIPYIPKPLYILASALDRYIIHPTQMVGRNSAYYKHLFYLTNQFNVNINQLDINQVLNEEEIKFGQRLSKYGKVIFQFNAGCIHLGGEKISCRWGLSDSKTCELYGINKERF